MEAKDDRRTRRLRLSPTQAAANRPEAEPRTPRGDFASRLPEGAITAQIAAEVYSHERVKAGRGKYQPPADLGAPEWAVLESVAGWANQLAERRREAGFRHCNTAARVLGLALHQWLRDPWVAEHKPSLRNFGAKPDKPFEAGEAKMVASRLQRAERIAFDAKYPHAAAPTEAEHALNGQWAGKLVQDLRDQTVKGKAGHG